MRFIETRPDPCLDSLFPCTGIDMVEDGESLSSLDFCLFMASLALQCVKVVVQKCYRDERFLRVYNSYNAILFFFFLVLKVTIK